MEVAKRSRGTPRIANRLLKRTRDFSQVRFNGMLNKDVVDKAPAIDGCGFIGTGRVGPENLIGNYQ